MKKTKYEWPKKLELKNEEERRQLWDETNYQRYRDNVRRANAKMRPLLVLPYFLFSTLYTLYLSFYVPFFEFKKLSKIKFLIDIEGLKPLVAWIRKIFKAIEIDEPILSVIGFVVFAVVIPTVFAFVIKKLIAKRNMKKYAGSEKEFAKNEKEQLKDILDCRSAMTNIKSEYESKLFKIGVNLVSIINLILFVSGRLMDGTASKDYDGNVILMLVIVFIVLNLITQFIYKKIFRDKSVGVKSEILRSVEEADARIFEIGEEEDRIAREEAEKKRCNEWISKIEKGYAFLENKEYNKAENELYKIRRLYDKKHSEICRWEDKRSEAYWDKDDDELYRCMDEARKIENEISSIEENIADISIALSIATFEKRKNKSEVSIAAVLGIIDKNQKDMKNSIVKTAAKKITDEYKKVFLEIAEKEYAVATDFLSDGDMVKGKMHLFIPNLMNYKDSEPLYAMLRLIVNNEPSEYNEIQSILVNTKDKVISETDKGAVEDAIAEIASWRKASGKLDSSHYDTIEFNAAYNVLGNAIKSTTISSRQAGCASQDTAENDTYRVYAGRNTKTSTSVSVDEAEFMDWTIKKHNVQHKNDKLREKGYKGKLNSPMGDSDFPEDVETLPKDVESFPNSDEIW